MPGDSVRADQSAHESQCTERGRPARSMLHSLASDATIPPAMLPALLLLLGLVQPPEPRLFLWTIIGLGEPGPNIVVTVTPTPFGLVSGVEVKAIALQPLPTRDDPKPPAIRPVLGRTSGFARNGFELRRRKGDRELRAVCSLQTHQLGWELVLEANGLLSRSQAPSSTR